MENKFFQIYNAITATIVCVVTLLTYFNINLPSSSQRQERRVEVLMDTIAGVSYKAELTKDSFADETNNRSAVDSEPAFSNETKSRCKSWEEMTTLDVVSLPFIPHEKKNYFKYLWDDYWWHLCSIIIFILWLWIYILISGWRYFTDIGNGNTNLKIVSGIIFTALLFIYSVGLISALWGYN